MLPSSTRCRWAGLTSGRSEASNMFVLVLDFNLRRWTPRYPSSCLLPPAESLLYNLAWKTTDLPGTLKEQLAQNTARTLQRAEGQRSLSEIRGCRRGLQSAHVCSACL